MAQFIPLIKEVSMLGEKMFGYRPKLLKRYLFRRGALFTAVLTLSAALYIHPS
jgi:hypothetical protein